MMKPVNVSIWLAGLFVVSLTNAGVAEEGKHLFILSGQSNMQRHHPDEAFTPAVQKALGKDNVIVVQDALGDSQSSAGTRNGSRRAERNRNRLEICTIN
jgi:hypothetical protein